MSPVSTNTYVNMILVISVLAWCCVGSPTAASQCFRTGTVLEQEGKSKSQNIPTSFYQLSEVSFIYANYFLSLIEYLYAWSALSFFDEKYFNASVYYLFNKLPDVYSTLWRYYCHKRKVKNEKLIRIWGFFGCMCIIVYYSLLMSEFLGI